jgi:hypothetical protein
MQPATKAFLAFGLALATAVQGALDAVSQVRKMIHQISYLVGKPTDSAYSQLLFLLSPISTTRLLVRIPAMQHLMH